MTLLLAVGSRDHFWMVTDRPLPYADRRKPVDDAVKILLLETVDGVGVLGYAGLGATAKRRTQPSEWMNDAPRGRGRRTDVGSPHRGGRTGCTA